MWQLKILADDCPLAIKDCPYLCGKLTTSNKEGDWQSHLHGERAIRGATIIVTRKVFLLLIKGIFVDSFLARKKICQCWFQKLLGDRDWTLLLRVNNLDNSRILLPVLRRRTGNSLSWVCSKSRRMWVSGYFIAMSG